MKLNSIHIKDIAGIRNLNLDNINSQVNVITGVNGVGKTTLLKAICAVLTSAPAVHLKRNVNSQEGSISATVSEYGKELNSKVVIKEFLPTIDDYISAIQRGRHIIYISDQRDFEYNHLDSVPRDKVYDNSHYNFQLINRPDIHEIKGWFVNRYLFSAHPDDLSPAQIGNYNSAISSFSAFDPDVTFSRVLSNTLDIMVNTPRGEIYFEYLSSGFKSILAILLGIIKEIEFRFPNSNVTADNFDGIILIDEIDLHLHPSWQAQIIPALTKIFPKAQFFVTTHSAHVVQSLHPEQLISLTLQDDNVSVKQNIGAEDGFMCWTVEEILTDIMGMESVNSQLFQGLWQNFSHALKEHNAERATKIAKMLQRFLHPENALNKIIDLQLTRFVRDDQAE